MKKLAALILLFGITRSYAGKVDTVAIFSQAMHKTIKCVVITPEGKAGGPKVFPAVYLLHGHGGSYSNWIKRVPQLSTLADQYQMIIVCPDGAVSSWYFDSPVDTSMKYETHVAREVPDYIDAHYKTIKERSGRAITGLSMGGHGGLFLGFRHADLFGGCGSMSGALLIEYITQGYDVEKRLGDTAANRQLYHDLSIMKEMEHYPKDSLAIIIDCGTQDRIIGMSRAAHEKMLKLKIPHDYIERPGTHDWDYWRNAIEYQLLFFRKYFDKGSHK
ncbi:MAG TPA: alpha/beta hydrolase family protein [Flavisolibacter sp.]|jgi:S-formylglutathione hydrolase FrmB|nr:alpha/beta hydrolase family protein [Flavisolibacter sp.]